MYTLRVYIHREIMGTLTTRKYRLLKSVSLGMGWLRLVDSLKL